MRTGHLVGLAFTLSCFLGLYLTWPYVKSLTRGNWLADLETIVFVAFVTLALSALHAVEGRVGAWFDGENKGAGDH